MSNYLASTRLSHAFPKVSECKDTTHGNMKLPTTTAGFHCSYVRVVNILAAVATYCIFVTSQLRVSWKKNKLHKFFWEITILYKQKLLNERA